MNTFAEVDGGKNKDPIKSNEVTIESLKEEMSGAQGKLNEKEGVDANELTKMLLASGKNEAANKKTRNQATIQFDSGPCTLEPGDEKFLSHDGEPPPVKLESYQKRRFESASQRRKKEVKNDMLDKFLMSLRDGI